MTWPTLNSPTSYWSKIAHDQKIKTKKTFLATILMYSIMRTLSQPCSAVTIKPAGPDTNLPKYTVTNTLPCTLTHTHTHTDTHAVTYKQTHTHYIHTQITQTHAHWPFCNLLMTKRRTCKHSQHFDYLDNGNTNKPHSKVTSDCGQIPPKTHTHSVPVSPKTPHDKALGFSTFHKMPLTGAVSQSQAKNRNEQKRHRTQRWVHHHLSVDFICWSPLGYIILGSRADSQRSWRMWFWM